MFSSVPDLPRKCFIAAVVSTDLIGFGYRSSSAHCLWVTRIEHICIWLSIDEQVNTHIFARRQHSGVVTVDGNVITWGASGYGRYANILEISYQRIIPHVRELGFCCRLGHSELARSVKHGRVLECFRSDPVYSLVSGDYHMLALTKGWEVYSWGYSEEGQCGHGTTFHLRAPRKIQAFRGIPIAQIAAGSTFSMAVTIEGYLYAWGNNDCQCFGLEHIEKLYAYESTELDTFGSKHNELVPRYIHTIADLSIVQVSCGAAHMSLLASIRNAEDTHWKEGSFELRYSLEADGNSDSWATSAVPSIRQAWDEPQVTGILEDSGCATSDSADDIDIEDLSRIFSLCRHDRLESVEEMLVNGFPVGARDESGNTLLSVAAQNGLKKMAKLIMSFGADLNSANNKGQTPLHFAFAYDFSEVAELLLNKGANDTITNQDGLTCYEGLSKEALDRF